MSFEKRHRRQVSNTDGIPKDDDEKSHRPSEDFDKTILYIQRKLDQIPPQYKQPQHAFNPLEQVIDMMKSTSLKDKKRELDANVRTLDKSMESIVKAHYDGFNKAIKNYTQILSHVTETGTNNTTLQNYANKCNTLFTSRSHSVNTMYLQSLEYSYMIEILDKIEDIKKVPERFQDAFNNQEYLLASQILVEAVDKLYQDDLLKIGALVELQAEIVGKKNSFHEVSIELLHNLIYMKEETELEDLGDTAALAASIDETKRNSTSKVVDIKSLDHQDAINYKLGLMDQLVSALFVLGKSSQAINKILERLRSELRHLIQKAIALVKKEYEKNPVLLQQILSRVPRSAAGTTSGTNSGTNFNFQGDHPNLFCNMLQMVFTKCTEILGYHKYVTLLFEDKLRAQIEAEEARLQELEASNPMKRPRGRSFKDTTSNQSPLSLNLEGESNSTTTYTLEHVWEEFQKEIQSLISYYINAPSESSSVNTASYSKSSKKQKQYELEEQEMSSKSTRLFSFSNSSAFTLYEVSETQSFQYRDMDMGIPSCYNLPSIYPFVSTFCDKAAQLVGVRNPSNRLQNWMDDFISTTLLTIVKNDYKKRINNAIQSAEAFKSRDTKMMKSPYSADDSRRPLINSVIEVYKAIKELYDDSVAMPQYATSFHSIMESCLMSFFDQAKSKFDELCKDTEVSKTVKDTEFQKLVLTDPNWKKLMRIYKLGGNIQNAAPLSASNPDRLSDPNHQANGNENKPLVENVSNFVSQRNQLRTASNNSTDLGTSSGTLDIEELEYLTNLMDYENAWHTGTTNAGLPIQIRHMILDPSKLSTLASLHDSLYWLADKVANLDRPESSNNKKTREVPISIKASLVSNTASLITSSSSNPNVPGVVPPNNASNTRSRGLQRTTSKDLNRSSGGTSYPKLSSHLTNMTWMLKELSDQCLQVIYVDFRLQTCYFLDGINRNYVYAAEDRSPDLRVVELNDSLFTTFQSLQMFLPTQKIRYLLANLPSLMSSLLIESLKSHIEAINRNGVVKMIRNVFALQQNLTNMTTFNEDPFDKVRRYYELLNLSLEEVYQFIAQHHREDPGSYSLNQYRTVLELLANPKSRSLTDEQEKDLRDKYILIPRIETSESHHQRKM